MEKTKKYLFITLKTGNDAEATIYTTDEKGYLKEEAQTVFIPDLGTDARRALFETAIYQKIKLHHRLESNQVTLSQSIDKTLEKLILEHRVTIHFESSGRPKEYVFFNEDDAEVHFYFNQITKESYEILKNNIETAVKTPLIIFNEIYILEGILKQNSLLQLLRNESWGNKIETNSSAIERRRNEFRELIILTPDEIENAEKIKAAKVQNDFISRGESGNFNKLEKDWENSKISFNEQIVACQFFLNSYPNSQNRIRVESKLHDFQDKEAWEKADNAKTIEAYLTYLIRFKDGISKEAAKQGILNLEIIYKNAVEPLEQNIEISSHRIKGLEHSVEDLEEKNQKYKRKSSFLMAGVVFALMAGAGISYFLFSKKAAAAITENPLSKRIDALIENRIYPKQVQLLKESKEVVPGSDEVFALLKTQENLNKALFGIQKVKFELLPQLETNKITANEVEREIIKVENEIK